MSSLEGGLEAKIHEGGMCLPFAINFSSLVLHFSLFFFFLLGFHMPHSRIWYLEEQLFPSLEYHWRLPASFNTRAEPATRHDRVYQLGQIFLCRGAIYASAVEGGCTVGTPAVQTSTVNNSACMIVCASHRGTVDKHVARVRGPRADYRPQVWQILSAQKCRGPSSVRPLRFTHSSFPTKHLLSRPSC